MEVKAIQQLLSQFRQVQENLQKQVESVHVETSAGGGMVVVRMNGQKQVTDLRIEPEVFKSKDQEMLQDLIRAAVNEASRRVDEELANQMKINDGQHARPGRPETPGPLLILVLHRDLLRSGLSRTGRKIRRGGHSVAVFWSAAARRRYVSLLRPSAGSAPLDFRETNARNILRKRHA